MTYKAIERHAQLKLSFLVPDKGWKSCDIPDSVDNAMKQLRGEMAQLNGSDAWYTARFSMTPEGKFKFDFDYNRLPAFSTMPEPDKWLDEFKKYPRPELQAQVQDWLDGRIGCDRADELAQRLGDLRRAG